MKLQFKHQPFQAEAATAVCDVFNGQPYRNTTYRLDLGDMTNVQTNLDMTLISLHRPSQNLLQWIVPLKKNGMTTITRITNDQIVFRFN